MAASSSSNPRLDLSLYLVTDETPAILGDKDLIHTVDEAIQGGVTIVQYRQKHGTQQSRQNIAAKLLEVTTRYNIPLIINDDIETCIAVGASGVHVGQDDMSLLEARRILGEKAIIGVSVSSVEEAKKAVEQGASYLGIGTMFATPTKTDSKIILGTRGTQAILAVCKTGTQYNVPCVAIGSINANNVQRVLHQTGHLENSLDGVAVVSAIMASPDPQSSARHLRGLITSAPTALYASIPPNKPFVSSMPDLAAIPAIIQKHVSSSILCHNMTNTVVQNFAANVCLATGSSPIMSLNGDEAADLAKLGGALVINMGTITPTTMMAYTQGLRAYNAATRPVLFDPVGGGATTVRKDAINTLLAAGFFDIIKGNEGEIGAVLGDDPAAQQQHGVDSGPSSRTSAQKALLASTLARRQRCVVLLTGATDYLSDGTRTLAISNGSHWLGKMTGSGCALGSVVVSYVGVAGKEDKLLAALAGILHYEIAAERAEKRHDVKGPGTFAAAFWTNSMLWDRL